MSKNQPVSVFVNFWVATFVKVTNVPDAPGEILGDQMERSRYNSFNRPSCDRIARDMST